MHQNSLLTRAKLQTQESCGIRKVWRIGRCLRRVLQLILYGNMQSTITVRVPVFVRWFMESYVHQSAVDVEERAQCAFNIKLWSLTV